MEGGEEKESIFWSKMEWVVKKKEVNMMMCGFVSQGIEWEGDKTLIWPAHLKEQSPMLCATRIARELNPIQILINKKEEKVHKKERGHLS